jgi:serine/threonine protein phosphatase 1
MTLGSLRPRIVYDHFPVSAIYAVGDVHGRLDLLVAAERRIVADAAGYPGPKMIVMLGDYVDRGPASCGVIDHLLGPVPASGFDRLCLCGNHDQAFFDFLESPRLNLRWLEYGGDATLQSYGIDARHILQHGGGIKVLEQVVADTVPLSHRRMLEELAVLFSVGPYVFVHAGVVPGTDIDDQEDSDFMWIREPFLSQGPRNRFTVVHAHTPSPEPVFGPGRIGIDTGAYATGKLTVLRVLPDDEPVVL